ncbi:MAG: NADH-quinone oxidoreductase subunit C [Candidatus Omnitrophota bacterium]
MTAEETIVSGFQDKFANLAGKIRVARQRRIFIEGVDHLNFSEVFDYAVREPGFSILLTITGLDEGQTLGFIYHMARPDGIILNIKTSVPKERPVLKTVCRTFPGAENYEREVADLLGAVIEGLPEGKRYPLPDDWPAGQYPLRKDWKPETKDEKETQ